MDFLGKRKWEKMIAVCAFFSENKCLVLFTHLHLPVTVSGDRQ